MTKVLSAAGLGQDILDMIPDIVNTCRECRMWMRPANETIPTLRDTSTFNQHVEVDLIFFKEHHFSHDLLWN